MHTCTQCHANEVLPTKPCHPDMRQEDTNLFDSVRAYCCQSRFRKLEAPRGQRGPHLSQVFPSAPGPFSEYERVLLACPQSMLWYT